MDIFYPALGIMAIILLLVRFSWIRSFRRGKPLLASFQLLTVIAMLLLIISSGLLIFSTLGYERLSYEQTLAHINIQKHSKQRFSAEIEFEDGSRQSYEISGDEIYIDARILKWKPWMNLLGIHSLFKLDRIGGRYIDYEHELSKQRSLFELTERSGEDLFDYRNNYETLGFMVDAKYGSATFIPIKNNAQYLLTLSTSGLILRELDQKP